MSFNAIAYVFLPREVSREDSRGVERTLYEAIEPNWSKWGKKHRCWEGQSKRSPEVWISVQVVRTENHLWEIEDELLYIHNALPEDLPEIICLVTNLGTEADVTVCDQLARKIAEKLDGVTQGARRSS